MNEIEVTEEVPVSFGVAAKECGESGASVRQWAFRGLVPYQKFRRGLGVGYTVKISDLKNLLKSKGQ